MTSNAEKLAADFQQELFNGYLEAKTRYRYNAARFFQMLEEHGGVETARRLLSSNDPYGQSGLTEMYLCKRLDLTVEARVLNPKYESLFASDLRAVAQQRLEDRDFDVAAWIREMKARSKGET